MSRRILVVGSANMDLVARVPTIPRPGETIIGTRFETIPGGKGANQAVAAARLGADTSFFGCLGDDAFAAALRGSLSEAGVHLGFTRTHPSAATGTAMITVADTGQNAIVVTPSANFELSPEDLESAPEAFAGTDAVLLQMEIPAAAVLAALRMARAHGALSILDIGSNQPVPPELLAAADVVSPNESEAEAITGVRITSLDDARAAARRLRERGAREVVLKLGAMGALHLGENALHVPAFPIKVADTTAAGDAFTAALGVVWGMCAPREALRFANAAGGLAASAHGAQPAMPARQAVDALVASD